MKHKAKVIDFIKIFIFIFCVYLQSAKKERYKLRLFNFISLYFSIFFCFVFYEKANIDFVEMYLLKITLIKLSKRGLCPDLETRKK